MGLILSGIFLYLVIYLVRWIYNLPGQIKLNFVIDNIISEHEDVLFRKYRQTHYTDEYGNIVEKGWIKEVKYFVDHIIQPNIHYRTITNNEFAMIEQKIRNHLSNMVEEYDDKPDDIEITTGVDYENYIEKILYEENFVVNRTPTTGDQGVDLIATKNGKRIAIQCKFYTKPVGNKAVQEVVAGKDFYECDYACVVSNNSYTPAARKLASVSNILLLNEDNIVEQLDELFGQPIQLSEQNTDNKLFSESFWKNITATKIKSQLKDIDDINMRDANGNSLLICAAMYNCSKDIVKTLIKLGADVSISDNVGHTALMAACSNSDDIDVIKYLITQGADINAVTDDGNSALFFAVGQNDNIEIIKTLIASGAKVNTKNNDGNTPLIAASYFGENIEIIKTLIASGAKVNAKNNDGITPLIAASCHGENIEIIKTLIASGAKINAKNNDGDTALFMAIANKMNVRMIKLLIDEGADVNRRTNFGYTALMYAIMSNNINVIKLIVNAGGDVNATTNDGTEILGCAIVAKNPDIVKILIDAGAVVNNNLRLLATEMKNKEIIKLLNDAGKKYKYNADKNNKN